MTIVLVHGVPETSLVWEPLLSSLSGLGRDDVLRLSPPGFGAALPDTFGATVDDYRGWLIDQLGDVDGPVDLVGHDWGGLHVLDVVMSRPDLVRSWVSDVLEHFEPDYTWHTLAQTWQTPGAGESQLSEMFAGTAADRTETMVRFGMPETVASGVAEGQGDEMARAILALYRSAAQPVMAELGVALPVAASRPGLYVVADADTFAAAPDIRRRACGRAGARHRTLHGLDHWWFAEDPVQAAQVLTAFWDSLT